MIITQYNMSRSGWHCSTIISYKENSLFDDQREKEGEKYNGGQIIRVVSVEKTCSFKCARV